MRDAVTIVGAGISGLSAGCYLAMNGYDVEIHEAQSMPGGLCTSWTRNQYTIDGCIHWLYGTRPGDEHYTIWQELGVAQAHRMLDHDVFGHAVSRDGRQLHWYTDLERLEQHLVDLSPRDAQASRALCALTHKLATLPMPALEPFETQGFSGKLGLLLRMLPYLRGLASIADLRLGQLAQRFSDPFLRAAVSNFLPDPDMPALVIPLTLGPMSRRSAGYPLGGSAPVARTIEARFRALGGRLSYGSRVSGLLERGGRAAGIRLESGAEVPARRVIAACDLRAALGWLPEGKRPDPVHQALLEAGELYAPLVLVSFGYAGVLPDEPSCAGTSYELAEPLELAGRRRSFFVVKSSSHDPSLAPAGKSVVQWGGSTDWAYWENLYRDRGAYEAAKQRLGTTCLEQIEARYPGFGANVEMTDVATPHTFQHYTGNWHGSYMTWLLPREFQRRHPFIPKTVAGLPGFYVASMWTNPPGGIVGATAVGRAIAQIICREDRRKFQTSVPKSPRHVVAGPHQGPGRTALAVPSRDRHRAHDP